MSGSLFVAHGDVSQLSADALVYSTDLYGRPGHLHAAFCRHVPGFEAAYAQALRSKGISSGRRLFAGETLWVPLPTDGQNAVRVLQGVIVVGVIGRDRTLNQKIVTAAIETAARHLEPAADGGALPRRYTRPPHGGGPSAAAGVGGRPPRAGGGGAGANGGGA